jgi:hypothetical protein
VRDAGPSRVDDAVKTLEPALWILDALRKLTLRSAVELNADFPRAPLAKWRPRMRCLFDFTLVDATK